MSDKVFLFPGQGSQSVGMGRDLYDAFGSVKKVFDDAQNILGFDIKKYCFEGPLEDLTKTDIVQPAITLLNIALFTLLKEHGVSPSVVCGHSLGEYSAVFAAGVLDLSTVLKLVQKRGKYMQKAADKNPGSMIAVVGLPREKVEELVADGLSSGAVGIANFNTQEQLIVSGVSEAVSYVSEQVEKLEGVRVIPLNVSGPWHSSLMQEARQRMVEELDLCEFSNPTVPIICNVTAEYATDGEMVKRNLIEQITGSVRWYETVKRLEKDYQGAQYLEVGPGRVLKGLVRSINRSLDVTNVGNVMTLKSFEH
ncbi:MAG: ACP S-malonyltransferase [Candidatus Ancaeobacter aquaticus]|nr:ACP S-malonyltransferase [Candidatus Ancaeobacter aquaticus]